MHPPDPKMRNPSAGQGKGGIISQSYSNTDDKTTDRDALQASRIVRLYFATAATIARLALLGAMNWTPVWYRQGGKSVQAVARELLAPLRALAGVNALRGRK